jgi:hypothetical protein
MAAGALKQTSGVARHRQLVGRWVGVAGAISLLTLCQYQPVITVEQQRRAGCELVQQRLAEKVQALEEWRQHKPSSNVGPVFVADDRQPVERFSATTAVAHTLLSYCPQLRRQFARRDVVFLPGNIPRPENPELAGNWVSYWRLPVVSWDGEAAKLLEGCSSWDGQNGWREEILFERRRDGVWHEKGRGLRWGS